MNYLNAFSIFLLRFLIIYVTLNTFGMSSKFDIHNNCDYTVWAAALPGGGKRLEHNETWSIESFDKDVNIWGRTNCNFDESGMGKCTTGDSDGRLQCQTKGKTPTTLAVFLLEEDYMNESMDYFGISISDGYNIPMQLTPNSDCIWTYSVKYTNKVNGQCPGMNGPAKCNTNCAILNDEQHCYQSCFEKLGKDDPAGCPNRDPRYITTEFCCATGATYNILFCP